MTQDTQNATPLRRTDGLLSAAVGEELMMMDATQGKYFNLNGVGARIWELLAVPTSLEALVTALTAEYDVEADTARQEVEKFLTDLRQRGLLVPDDAAAT